MGWIAAGVLALALLALGVAYFKHSASGIGALRLTFTPPENLAFDNGQYDYVIVSPDGQKLVFTGRSADGKRQLYVRSLDAMEATVLPGTDDALAPFWSPDSRSLGFGSQGKLKRIDLAGGRPQTLCDADRLEGGTWSRNGVIVFAPLIPSGLFQIPATGGELKPVTKPDTGQGHRYPYFLPDGRHFFFALFGAKPGIAVGSLDSNEVKTVLADTIPAVYAPPGWLLFVHNGALHAQAFDADKLDLRGEAFPLMRKTNVEGQRATFSVSENGVLVWQGMRQSDYQPVWFDRAGRQLGTIGPPMKTTLPQYPTLSPDGMRIALRRTDTQKPDHDIWIIDQTHNVPIRLTSDPANEDMLFWTPDSRQAGFTKTGSGAIYQKDASGLGKEELLLKAEVYGAEEWSLDGRFLIMNKRGPNTRRDVVVWARAGTGEPYPLLNSEFDEYHARLSPDGRWLDYVSDESGNYEVYVQAFTSDGKLGSEKKRISTSGGNQPRFSRNGRELFYIATDGQMMAVALKPGSPTFEYDPPKALFITRMLVTFPQSGTDYDVTADGQRFLIGTIVGEPTPVSVIVNWAEGLKK
jgi:Tol biopolymer transport system component